MQIYTLPEVANLLRCSERQLYRFMASGKLAGSKHGKWRFTDDDVRAFLDSGRKHRALQENNIEMNGVTPLQA